MRNKIFTLAIVILLTTPLLSQIKLPAVIGDNMVLQQKSDAAVWGWGEPGSEIKVTGSWNNDTVKTKISNHSFWSVKLKTPSAGGPYTVNIKSGNELTLKNVMIGEVWICSGQSNMEWSASQNLLNAEEEIRNASYPNIRLLHVKKLASETPQDNCFAEWEECSPASMRTFSSVGYFFSRTLHQNLNIPVGIIEVAWGGTPAEVWVKSDLIEADPLLKSSAAKLITYDWWPNKPGVTYNSMIKPLIPYSIAGAIWYQGEGNTINFESYRKLMNTLIGNWRSDFGKEFPFYFVQIAPYAYGKDTKAAMIREMQTKTMYDIPKTGMVIVSDLVDDIKNIHPANKQDVGKRLANWALSETYGIKGIAYKSPMYESMKTEKSKIRISFQNVPNGLVMKGDELLHFEIAGSDKVFVPASAKIDGNTVIVSAKGIKAPEAVRFSFSNDAMGNIFSKEGLPVAPFRTDSWEY
ncbi:MAG: sialate O-acetylesterase [Bacteroidetes bacterium]|nr:sialate O-acetylesterase [Bacteroidota bacterium]